MYRLAVFLLSIVVLSIQATFASTGAIDTSATNKAKVCYDTTCTSPAPSSINFELEQEPSIVIDSVTGISGKVWGNSLGWITLNPTGAGVTFSNTTSGLLTGKAWSQVSGWINFAPTGQSVTINPSTGEFLGWAWTGGPYGGWIRFDCADSATCVKTTWRASVPPPPPVDVGPVLIDVCSNIEGIQTVIPSGYSINIQGQCVRLVDVCPNIAGEQTILPRGYQYDSIGACVPEAIDYCPNIVGVQRSIPTGMIIAINGDCVLSQKDVCPEDSGIQTSTAQCSIPVDDMCLNLSGIQERAPDGYAIVEGLCYQSVFDYCPNIDGIQTGIPNGFTVTSNGDCAPLAKDFCANLSGTQEGIPVGFRQEGKNCFFTPFEEDFAKNTKDGMRVIALPFIPSIAWVVSDNAVIKQGAKTVDIVLGTDLTTVPYVVDLVSVGVVTVSAALLLLFVVLLLRLLYRKLRASSPL